LLPKPLIFTGVSITDESCLPPKDLGRFIHLTVEKSADMKRDLDFVLRKKRVNQDVNGDKKALEDFCTKRRLTVLIMSYLPARSVSPYWLLAKLGFNSMEMAALFAQ
jgi:hypothetical protein